MVRALAQLALAVYYLPFGRSTALRINVLFIFPLFRIPLYGRRSRHVVCLARYSRELTADVSLCIRFGSLLINN